MTFRHPLKKHSFDKIKDLGIPINTFLDVCFSKGIPEAMMVFGNLTKLFFDPFAEWLSEILSKK